MVSLPGQTVSLRIVTQMKVFPPKVLPDRYFVLVTMNRVTNCSYLHSYPLSACIKTSLDTSLETLADATFLLLRYEVTFG